MRARTVRSGKMEEKKKVLVGRWGYVATRSEIPSQSQNTDYMD